MKAIIQKHKFASIATAGTLLAMGSALAPEALEAQTSKPNILVIWGDDIGQSNISAYTRGMMGYHTKNIDRIADEGMLFTDYYGEQSCTAGRATFMTGQTAFRTGLTKVGMPGADLGLQAEDPTIPEILKNAGYATAQFGKNHFGDKDEFLPTNHGFDEFFGNLYHLNAEEEPEDPDYPQDPAFRERFGPRGVIRSTADGVIQDTGPLTRKRMETVDEETLAAAKEFIRRKEEAGEHWFVWWNGTRMHFRTHLKEGSEGLSGQDEYSDAMVEHDMHVGELLDLLDKLGIADETIVFYSTDNGPHKNTWPDAASSPFRGEKNSNWEGAYRVPALIKWPGVIEPGSVSNEIMHHMDWLPTFADAAGLGDVKSKLLNGYSANGKNFNVHLDGFSFLPYFKGEVDEGPREEIYYFNDVGELTALRFDDWKLLFMYHRPEGTLNVWQEPFVPLRLPYIFNLRRDPYEFAQITSNGYYDWMIDKVHLLYNAQARVADHMNTYLDYPPRQKPASFSVDQITEGIMQQVEAMNSVRN